MLQAQRLALVGSEAVLLGKDPHAVAQRAGFGHLVMSAASPSPPGRPSLPNDRISKSPLGPGLW